jgi:hypothetical protein
MSYEQSLSRLVDSVKELDKSNDDSDRFVGNIDPYRVNRRVSASVVLKNNFPTIEYLLGGKIFSALSQVYAKFYPSNWWDINVYGSEFPSFLQAQTNSPKANEFNWLLMAEIAQLEYAFIDRYYYPGHASTDDNIVNLDHINFQIQYEIFRHHPQLIVSYNGSDLEISKAVLIPNAKLLIGSKEFERFLTSKSYKEIESIKFQSARVFREDFQVVVEFLCKSPKL